MKNRKWIIVIIVLLGIVFASIKIYNSYIFNEDGTLSDGKTELIEHLKSIEDKEERKKQIDFSVESNIITKQEANKLY